MRFIVDFYRWVILGSIGLSITLIVFVALKLGTSETGALGLTGAWLLGGGLVLAFFVMSLGITATFISMHDRHADLVGEVKALRIALTQRDLEA
jgi:hypothetical protein